MPVEQTLPAQQRAGGYSQDRPQADRFVSIPSLTGLRFVAALMILVSHSVSFMLPLGSPMPAWQQAIRSLAYLGMPLFFVLSGFVIHYNYSHPIQTYKLRGIYNFFVARFARLFPLYIVCISFDVVWRYLYDQLPANAPYSLIYYASMTQSWLYHISGEHSLIFQFGVMPQVSWSISTEWFFYAVYPLICFGLVGLNKRRLLIAAGICVVATLAGLLVISRYVLQINQIATSYFGELADATKQPFDSFVFWLLYFSPYSRIGEFLLGTLAAAIFLKLRDRPISHREQVLGATAMFAAIVMLGYLFWLTYTLSDFTSPGESSFLLLLKLTFGFAPFLAALVFCAARYQNPLVSLLSLPKLVICGEASYSLYMLHLEVVYAFRWTVAPASSVGVQIANGMRWGLLLLTAIGLSIVVWQFLEVPARRWLRRALSWSNIFPNAIHQKPAMARTEAAH